MRWLRKLITHFFWPDIQREVAEEVGKQVEKRVRKIKEEVANEGKQALASISKQRDKAIDEIINTAKKTMKEEVEKWLRETADRIKEMFETALSEMIEKMPQKIITAAKSQRGEKVKIIFDGENYCGVLKYVFKKEWIPLPELLDALNGFLKKEAEIGEIYFYDSGRYRVEREGLWGKLKEENDVKLKIIPPQFIRSAGKYKEMIDSYIGVEIMKTKDELQYGTLILFSGDGHFAPFLKEVGEEVTVIVVCSRWAFSLQLINIAHRVIYLEDMLGRER